MSTPPVNLRVNELTGANVAKNFEDVYRQIGVQKSAASEVLDQTLFQQIRNINGSFVVGLTGEGVTKQVDAIY
jgi:hypothetical protein